MCKNMVLESVALYRSASPTSPLFAVRWFRMELAASKCVSSVRLSGPNFLQAKNEPGMKARHQNHLHVYIYINR